MVFKRYCHLFHLICFENICNCRFIYQNLYNNNYVTYESNSSYCSTCFSSYRAERQPAYYFFIYIFINPVSSIYSFSFLLHIYFIVSIIDIISGIMSVIQGNQMPIGYFADRCKRRCEIKQRPHTSTYRDEK